MKKYTFIILILLLAGSIAEAQNWKWSDQLECAGHVAPTSIVSDADNNVYLCGTFENSNLTINSETLPTNGMRDGFICKFDDNGSVLWLVGIGGTTNDELVKLSISNNKLFVLGNFQSPYVYFTPSDSLPNTNHWDSFLASYDLDGNFLDKAKLFGGTNMQRTKSMLYDPLQDNFLIVSMFKNEIIYTDGSGSVTVNAKGPKDMFIARTNELGIVLDTAIHVNSIVKTNYQNILSLQDEGFFLAGDVFGTTYFSDTDSITGNSTTTSDAYIVKIDTSLNFKWARKGGGLQYDHANSSVTDKYGNIYFTGKCGGTIEFDSTETLKSTPIDGFGDKDLYIAKYNKLGTYQWARVKGDAGPDDAFGLTLKENLLQFCGNIAGEVIFNTDTLRSSGLTDQNTGFAIFDVDGNEIGAQGIGGTGLDNGRAITFSPNGNTVISGFFDSPAMDIGDSSYTNSSGTQDGFIASYYYPMSAVITAANPLSCNGDTDGSLLATTYFGVGPYNYTWSANVITSNDSVASGLGAGTYSVTITDSRLETASTSFELSEPTEINIGAVQTDVSCHTSDIGPGNDGNIDLTVTGGTVAADYDYTWIALSGSGANASDEDQNTLTKGEYRVTVKDDNLCEATETYLINQPDSISFSGSIVTNASGGWSDGAVNLVPSGGTQPYSFLWSNDSITEDIDSLAGGSYTVTLTDNNTCKADTSFLVEDITLFQAYISSKTDVDCRLNSTGSATVATAGGTGSYSYAWTIMGSPVGGNSSHITGLSAGTYNVIVTDLGDARTASAFVTITQPNIPLSAFISLKNLDCYEDNSGQADLNVSGGTLPYEYLWSNGETTEDIIDLAANNYNVVVTDNNGCIVIENVSITQPAAPLVVTDIVVETGISCFGDINGVLTATVTGGTGSPTYSWNDPGNQTGRSASGLTAGNYQVTATDIKGCEASNERLLSEPPKLQLGVIPDDVSCYNHADGKINLNVSGGTGNPVNFGYAWSGGQNTQDIENLKAGNYFVTVTDLNLCSDTISAPVIQPEEIVFQNIDLTPASCRTYADGGITLSAQGGSGSFEYSIDGGTSYSASPVFSDIPADAYTLIIADELVSGCESSDSTVNVAEPEGTTVISEDKTDISCYNADDGSITINATNPVGGLEYSIDNGANFFPLGNFENQLPGNYQIQFRDADNCVQSGSLLTILEPDSFSIELQEKTDISCFNADDGTIALKATSTAGGMEYSVDGGESFSAAGDFENQTPGNYQIQFRDADNCVQSGSLLTIEEPDSIRVDTFLTMPSETESGQISMNASGGTSPYTYIIHASASDSMYNESGEFLNLTIGNYEGYVTDDNRCTSDNLNFVLVQTGSGSLIIYDAFSPNDDGVNETWTIGGIEKFPNCSVTIFNSWGNKVFNSSGYLEPWDGTFNGNALPGGTYYYVIDLKDGSDPITGPVNIVL